MSKQFHCTFSDDFSTQLSDLCAVMDVSPQQLITDAVLAYIKNYHNDTLSVPPDGFSFIDLFAGIGGMRIAYESAGGHCVFSSEWDKKCQETYFKNFGEIPYGDITKISASDIPDGKHQDPETVQRAETVRIFPRQDTPAGSSATA